LHAIPQAPPEQVAFPPLDGGGHTVLQFPQCCVSSLVFKQTPLQLENPVLQSMPQLPALHVGLPFAGGVQPSSHSPQFAGSEFVSTQTPPQLSSPEPQLLVHAPLEQTSSRAHETSQLPQYDGFVFVSTQAPSQATKSPVQLTVQTPASHWPSPPAGASHTLSHSPQ